MKSMNLDLTPKERATRYAKGEEVDRIPTTLSAGETMALTYGYDMREYYFSAEQIVDVENRFYGEVKQDAMSVGLGLHGMAEAVGSKIKYSQNSLLYVETPVLKKIEERSQLRPVDVEKDGRIPVVIEALNRLQEQYGEEFNVSTSLGGPFTFVVGLLGAENFLKATRKNTEAAHELLQFATDNIIHVCKEIHARTGASTSLAEPLAAMNLLSLKQFQEFVKPYVKQIVTELNTVQTATGMHICGYTHDRWEDIMDTGIIAFSVDNCERMEDLKRVCGSRIGIIGNIPPVEILRNGSLQDVKDSVIDCILQGGDSPNGFTLSPGCQVPANCPVENLQMMLEAAYEYGKNASKGEYPEGIRPYLA